MDEKNVDQMLIDEIKSEFDALSSLKIGSEERSYAIRDLTDLYEVRLKAIEADRDFKEKNEKMSAEKKERIFRIVISVIEIGAPMIFYSIWMRRGFQFEKDGAFTSTTFKELFKRFKPTK